MLHDNLESRITFEVPSSTADFDKLIRDNNYTLFWQNLHSTGESGLRSGASGASELLAGHKDRNATSDYGQLMGSLKGFAGERGGPYGWGLPDEVGLGVDGAGPLLVDPSYLWIGAVMVLLVLSGLFCVCSCYLYYKYRRWQKCVSITSCHQTAHGGTLVGDVESPPPYDPETTTTTLPSYTVASGLPSYEDAVEHIYRQQQLQRQNPPPASVHPPATVKFFESRPQNWLAVTIFEEIHYNFVGRGGTTTSPSTVVSIPEKVEDESEGDLLGTWRQQQQQQHEEKPRPLGRR
uniref:Protein commissureless n=1 Tax=Culex pipiens TaxID=7175 RepID=A0A8D8C535_CULPI